MLFRELPGNTLNTYLGGEKIISSLDYKAFLATKSHPDEMFGFSPLWLPDCLFGFQRMMDDWAIRKGRAALLEDCGLGKTVQELVFAENVVRHTNKPFMLFTPLAVGPQMVEEGRKFGIECTHVRDGRIRKGINVTNYEQLPHFSAESFGGCGVDEAGAIKHHDSVTRKKITKFLSNIRYRLLATATPAPNDFMELGTSSEALGVMGRQQMLGMFFSNGQEETQKWVLKGHAKKKFWRWVCTWARALRKPSDLGFPNDGFDLPPLITNRHVVSSPHKTNGKGFGILARARTLKEQRAERKATIKERCEKVAELAQGKDYVLIYCHLNPEGDLLQKLIPGSVNVQGSDSEARKEEMLTNFASGKLRCLITKPRLGGWGLNLQHCNHVISFVSHSMESHYQCIRRCWRFGQKRPVTLDLVTSRGEGVVVDNLLAKERRMDEMFSGLVQAMGEYQFKKIVDTSKLQELETPSWL